jgi:hypothetical protein
MDLGLHGKASAREPARGAVDVVVAAGGWAGRTVYH